MTKELQGEQQLQPQKLSDLEKTECEIKVELLHRVLNEVALLSIEHHKESPLYGLFEYKPNWDSLLQYAMQDKCVLVTVRYKGTLVGYSVALIGPFDRSIDTDYAQIEAFYVNPAFRTFPVANTLKKTLEGQLQGRAEFVLIGSSIGGSIQKFFSHFGYVPIETILCKRLSDVREESTSSTTELS